MECFHEAGEWMLKGFIFARGGNFDHAIESANACFSQAIAKNATFISLFTGKVGTDGVINKNKGWRYKLAIQSAELGDERDLWRRGFSSVYPLSDDSFFTYLLHQAAKTANLDITIGESTRQWTKDVAKQQAAFKLIEKGLAVLRNNQTVPIIDKHFALMLSRIAEFLFSKKLFSEAEEVYHYAIEASGKAVSIDLLLEAAQTKRALKKYDESEKLCMAAEEASIPPKILFERALSKQGLKKYRQAEQLYDRAIEKTDENIPQKIFAKIAEVKFILNKHEEAEKFSDRAIKAYGNKKIPATVLSMAIRCKVALNKFEEAEGLGSAVEPESTPLILLNLALSKQHLKKNEEAEELYNRAIKMTEEKNIPKEFLVNIAKLKFLLKKHEEAEKFSDMAVNVYENQVPMTLFSTAINIKKALNKHSEAEELSEQVKLRFGEKVLF